MEANIQQKQFEYFELYELLVSLKVDKSIVEEKYYALSKRYHPDNFSLNDAEMQASSLEKSSAINMAKKILMNTHKRLAYILKENKTIEPDEKYVLSPAFLGEMMDINEQLMELEFEENETVKTQIIIDLKEIENNLFKKVSFLFEQESLDLNSENCSLLKDYYYKKKYIDRIKEKLEG
jgi:molecular chaperone HscB